MSAARPAANAIPIPDNKHAQSSTVLAQPLSKSIPTAQWKFHTSTATTQTNTLAVTQRDVKGNDITRSATSTIALSLNLNLNLYISSNDFKQPDQNAVEELVTNSFNDLLNHLSTLPADQAAVELDQYVALLSQRLMLMTVNDLGNQAHCSSLHGQITASADVDNAQMLRLMRP